MKPEEIIDVLKEHVVELFEKEDDGHWIEAIPESSFASIAERLKDDWVSENPFKDLKCDYVYDYCNPQTCNCRKSSQWKGQYEALLDISKDVVNEVMRAKTMFPNNFVNQHEAYAVILEEVDELWDEIKKNQKVYDLKAQRKEAIQACAMLFRFINELLPTPPTE